MGLADPGYTAERERVEVAVRMIRHEARTCTIKLCTGLSDDRIRRLYAVYFKGDASVRRQRGKSPSRTRVFVKNPTYQCEATTLAVLFAAFDLVRIERGRAVNLLAHAPLAIGRQLCLAYETYRALHVPGRLSFERAWSLLQALISGEELALVACRECFGLYVRHLLEIDTACCPCCRLTGQRPTRRRATALDLPSRTALSDRLEQAVADAPAPRLRR